MKLSPAAELAVRGVVILSDRYGEGPISLDTVCTVRDLPKQYLVKIFSSLAKADIVTPVRGKHGGYMLARRPDQITLLEVVEAVEGPIILNYCQHSPPRCDFVGCPMRAMWAELQQVIRDRLSGMTLSDCMTSAHVEESQAKGA